LMMRKPKWTCLKCAPIATEKGSHFPKSLLVPRLDFGRKERNEETILNELKNHKEKDISIRHGQIVKRTPR